MNNVLKKIVLMGTAAGAIAGGVGEIVYVWSLALINILRDLKHFADYELIIFGFFCFLAFIPSILLGAGSGAVLGLLFQKFRDQKDVYMIASVALCVLIVIGSLTLLLGPNWIDRMTVSDPYSSESTVYLALCATPGIFYSLLGLFISRYMFNKFKLVELEYQASSEKDGSHPSI